MRLRTHSAVHLFEKPVGNNKFPLALAVINKLRLINDAQTKKITCDLEALAKNLQDIQTQYETIVSKRAKQKLDSMAYIATKKVILGENKSRSMYLILTILKTYDDVMALLILIKDCGGLDRPQIYFKIKHQIQKKTYSILLSIIWQDHGVKT